jgi:hypothetical protein
MSIPATKGFEFGSGKFFFIIKKFFYKKVLMG